MLAHHCKNWLLLSLLTASGLLQSGCRFSNPFSPAVATPAVQTQRQYKLPPPPTMQPHALQYSDSEGFDLALDTAIRNGTPYIVVQTDATSPAELNGRLGDWVAAWKDGGVVQNPNEKGLSTAVILHGMQVLNSEEFHTFMASAVEQASKVGAWYQDQQVRKERVGILKPYILAFNTQPNQPIQVMLYNGQYERALPSYFTPQLTQQNDNGPAVQSPPIQSPSTQAPSPTERVADLNVQATVQ